MFPPSDVNFLIGIWNPKANFCLRGKLKFPLKLWKTTPTAQICSYKILSFYREAKDFLGNFSASCFILYFINYNVYIQFQSTYQKTLFFDESIIHTSLNFKLPCFLFYTKELGQPFIIINFFPILDTTFSDFWETEKPPFSKTWCPRILSQTDFLSLNLSGLDFIR